MSRKWVVNASPLIVLGKVAEIALLERLCSTLVIPDGVVHELDRGPNNDPAREVVLAKGSYGEVFEPRRDLDLFRQVICSPGFTDVKDPWDRAQHSGYRGRTSESFRAHQN